MGTDAEALAAALEAQCSASAMGASAEDAERQQAASLLREQAGEIQYLRAHVAARVDLLDALVGWRNANTPETYDAAIKAADAAIAKASGAPTP